MPTRASADCRRLKETERVAVVVVGGRPHKLSPGIELWPSYVIGIGNPHSSSSFPMSELSQCQREEEATFRGKKRNRGN